MHIHTAKKSARPHVYITHVYITHVHISYMYIGTIRIYLPRKRARGRTKNRVPRQVRRQGLHVLVHAGVVAVRGYEFAPLVSVFYFNFFIFFIFLLSFILWLWVRAACACILISSVICNGVSIRSQCIPVPIYMYVSVLKTCIKIKINLKKSM